MAAINNILIRSIFTILLGILLAVWPEAAITYLVVTIGILFLIPGVLTLVKYFTQDRGKTSVIFPIEAAGSILFGGWLVIMPQFFVNIIMYLLGALLILGGIQQLIFLVSARKTHIVPVGFFIMPVLIVLTGILIMAYPFSIAATTFIVFGAASIIYGVSEFINWYQFCRGVY
ncbi:MAG: DUF308 domain-containing protein [Tannerellaceae bacterium]|nr:DUF308 domain-containing protein [Tannerellaceae bacterium]